MCLTEYDEAKYTDFVRAEGEAIGMTKGEAKGMIKAIIGFFKDGLISEKDAAKRANMSLEDFRKAEVLYSKIIADNSVAYPSTPQSISDIGIT